MSDIFVSYKREEQRTARALADVLERYGWSVWWDPKLRAGEHFDDVIEAALRDARCVVVLWSKQSVQSRYVRDEATYALNRDKLVPIAIEIVTPPFRFQGIQTPQLFGWDGSETDSEFKKLIEDLTARLGKRTLSLPTRTLRSESRPRPAATGALRGDASQRATLPTATQPLSAQPRATQGAAARALSSPTPATQAAVADAFAAGPAGGGSVGEFSDFLERALLWLYWPAWLAIPLFNITGGDSNDYAVMLCIAYAAIAACVAWQRRRALAWYWWSVISANALIVVAMMLDPHGLITGLFPAIIAYVVVGPLVGIWLRARIAKATLARTT